LGISNIRIYSILDFLKYLLLKSILLDNYNIIYIINNIHLFNKGLFIPEYREYIIKIKSSSLLIFNYNIYIIKNILNRKKNKINLILNNIIIIKGFHVNIILETLLYKRKI